MRRAVIIIALSVAACAPLRVEEQLPAAIRGKATVLAPTDADYSRAVVEKAVNAEGKGGVARAVVVRLDQDATIYRMWNGPGGNNRLGSWWAFDKPVGTREGYRRAYEICGTWNALQWVAACTLKKGAVVAVGPGQSVSAETCQDASGYETYAANAKDWQVFVYQPWNRGQEFECPDQAQDYQADPANVSQPAK